MFLYYTFCFKSMKQQKVRFKKQNKEKAFDDVKERGREKK